MAKRPSKVSLNEILSNPDLKIDGDLNVLAMMCRRMIQSLSIKPMEWENLTTAYYRKKWGDDVKKIREEKSNLATSLESDTLTWGRFEQVLQVLGADSADFTVGLNYPKGITVDSTLSMRFKRRGSKSDPTVEIVINRAIESCEGGKDGSSTDKEN